MSDLGPILLYSPTSSFQDLGCLESSRGCQVRAYGGPLGFMHLACCNIFFLSETAPPRHQSEILIAKLLNLKLSPLNAQELSLTSCEAP